MTAPASETTSTSKLTAALWFNPSIARKRVDTRGRPLSVASAPVTWGQAGSNGQHAFFQMLHLGTDVVPVEFIAVVKARHNLPGHQPMLLANGDRYEAQIAEDRQQDAPYR